MTAIIPGAWWSMKGRCVYNANKAGMVWQAARDLEGQVVIVPFWDGFTFVNTIEAACSIKGTGPLLTWLPDVAGLCTPSTRSSS